MKNITKLSIITLIILIGIVSFSCTDGESLGTGGGGTLNIVGIPDKYNGNFVTVSVSDGTNELTYGTARRVVKSGYVRAAVYDKTTGDKYTGNSTYSSVEVKIYKNKTTSTVTITQALGSVKFTDGGGVVYWPKTP